ncbi:MAG: hypothetical protein ABIS68_02910 [Casimicrobiaceae bacterium]
MAGLRLITPAWQQRAKRKKAFAAVARREPQTHREGAPDAVSSRRTTAR